MTTVLVGARLQQYAKLGALGPVIDTIYVDAYWPKLDAPTPIFTKDSAGIQVMGRTPSNVQFPAGTKFLDYVPDALYPAELAVQKAAGKSIPIVNLSPELSQVWWNAYQAAAAQILKENPNATVTPTNSDCHFTVTVQPVTKTETQVVTKANVEVEPGVFADVAYEKEVQTVVQESVATQVPATDADGNPLPVVKIDPGAAVDPAIAVGG